MINSNYTSLNDVFQELGIHAENITHEYIGGEKYVVIHATVIEPTRHVCPECGSVSVYKNGYYTRTIKHTPMFGYNCIIKLKQLRLKCRDCDKSFNENCNLVSKNRTMSTKLIVKTISDCKHKRSFKDIGIDLNISPTSVMNIFNDNIYIDKRKLTRIICIDEFSADTEFGKYALSIGDPETGDILDILPSRTQEYIYHYFNDISLEERNNVKYVITDLCESYRSVVKSLFFKSTHIADRFHWIKLSTTAFNVVRIRIMKEYLEKCKITKDYEERKKYSLIASLMKKYYKVFLANRYRKESIFFSEELPSKIFNKHLTRQAILEFTTNNNDELDKAYWLLQDLYYISIFSSYETIYKDLNEWFDKVNESDIREFKKVMTTYREWFKEIRNSFLIDDITKKRLTNGFIEGKNNICKVIKRVGFGYKKFANLRNRILYENKELIINNK